MQKKNRYRSTVYAIFKRMDEIAAECGSHFPLFLPGMEEQWTLSARGSWLGGFWAGLWWRRCACTRSADDQATASAWSTRLQPMLQEPSINRSFVFWYGAAIGHQELGGDQAAGLLATRAAQAIAADFDSSAGVWTMGTGMGAGEEGTRRINVDALAPTLALLHGYGGADGCAQAHQHLRTCLRYLATDYGAWRANAILNADGTVQQDEAGAWPRGQAWAMLGMAEAVRLYGEPYREAALRACAYWHWREHWGSARAKPGPQSAPQDLSAQVIAAVAMLKLFQFLPDQHWLHQQARTQLDMVLENKDVAEHGRFAGQRYRIRPGEEHLVESACATFFLLEALLSYRRSATSMRPADTKACGPENQLKRRPAFMRTGREGRCAKGRER